MATRRSLLALLGAGVLARPVWAQGGAQGRTIVDSANRRVTLPDRVSRVFVAGPPASVLMYLLAPDLMVGWIRLPTPAEKEFLTAPARDLPETGRLTGRGDTVSLERLVAAKPDLVVDFGSVTETYVSLANRVQEQTGIPYVLIDGTFAATPASLKLAADIVGRSARGAELASYAAKTFVMVDEVLARVPTAKRPKVYLARGPEGLGGRGNTANASLEQVVAWQPDAIVTLDRAFFAGVKTKPGWDQVRAVAENKVYLAPSLPWGWIDAPPSINRLMGLRWLLKTFYPTETAIDLRTDTRFFYALFYGVKLEDSQLDRLLGGAAAR